MEINQDSRQELCISYYQIRNNVVFKRGPRGERTYES